MKNFILIYFLCLVGFTYSQVQWNYISSSGGKCVDVYDGTITYSISGATPPFTAVITNTAGCSVANPTITSSTSQITFTGIPGCTSFYYFSLYNSSNTLISSFQTSFGVYSSTPFTIAIPSSTPATCSSCCDGKAMTSWSGGSFQNSTFPNFYLDNVYLANNFYPIMGICPGSHTLCADDNVGCQKCVTFTMPANATNIVEYSRGREMLGVYPNPVNNEFKVTCYAIQDGDVILVKAMTGQELISLPVRQNLSGMSVDATNLSSGIYFIQVVSGAGNVKGSAKIIKK